MKKETTVSILPNKKKVTVNTRDAKWHLARASVNTCARHLQLVPINKQCQSTATCARAGDNSHALSTQQVIININNNSRVCKT